MNTSKSKKTSSTKNRDSEDSIFRVIERAKAKSNGTTPQNAQSRTPSHCCGSEAKITPTSPVPKLIKGPLDLQLSILTSSAMEGESKRPPEFKTPTSYDMPSPLGTTNASKKKGKTGISFISSIFGSHNQQSPARVTLAKKFLKEKVGEELFSKIEAIKESDQNNFATQVKEILGPDHRHVFPVVEYVFTSKTLLENTKPSLPKPSNFTLSPISNQTCSTTTHDTGSKDDKLGLTFGKNAQKSEYKANNDAE